MLRAIRRKWLGFRYAMLDARVEALAKEVGKARARGEARRAGAYEFALNEAMAKRHFVGVRLLASKAVKR